MPSYRRIKSRLEPAILLKGRIGITGMGSFFTGIMANGSAPYPDILFQVTRFLVPGVINPSRREGSFQRELCDFDSKSGKWQVGDR